MPLDQEALARRAEDLELFSLVPCVLPCDLDTGYTSSELFHDVFCQSVSIARNDLKFYDLGGQAVHDCLAYLHGYVDSDNSIQGYVKSEQDRACNDDNCVQGECNVVDSKVRQPLVLDDFGKGIRSA